MCWGGGEEDAIGIKWTTNNNYSAQTGSGAIVEKPCFNWILAFPLIMNVDNPSQGC